MPGLTARQLTRLPWTYEGPRFCQPRPDEVYFELRIKELPDFFLAGESVEEVLAGLADALEAYLQTYLDAGEMPPRPVDQTAWRLSRPPKTRPETVVPSAMTLTMPDAIQIG